MQEQASMDRREPSTRVRRTTFSDQERAEILKLLSTRNDRRRQLTEKQRRKETERARERRRKMTGDVLLEWRRRHAENARRRRAAMLQERIKIQERVKKTLSLQQYPKSFAFTCGLCPRTFNNRWQLTQHRGKAHRQNDGRYVCEECGKTTAKVRDMIVHKRGRHNMAFCNIYPIKNNNAPQSVIQEINQLSLQENQPPTFNSMHCTPNSNELLSNSFHQSNFTNYLSRFTSQGINQYQPNYFNSRSVSSSMEGNEITGSSYKMLTDYIKQTEMMKYDTKHNLNLGYQPIHHFENNFDQEFMPKSCSFNENYSSFLSSDAQEYLPKTHTNDQGYTFPSHILNQIQLSNQNPLFQSESLQSVYEWQYKHNQNPQQLGSSVRDLPRNASVSNQQSLALQRDWQNNGNVSEIKEEDNYGLKIASVESQNKQGINKESKTFSILQPSQNNSDSGTILCNEFKQPNLQKWLGFESKSMPTFFKSESDENKKETTLIASNSTNLPKSQLIIDYSEDTTIEFEKNKPTDICNDSVISSSIENKHIYSSLEGNSVDITQTSQIQPINDSKFSEDNKINIQSHNFSINDKKELMNFSSKSSAGVQSNAISTIKFIEELESEIKFCVSKQPSRPISLVDQQVQNITTDSKNHVTVSQISDSCNQNNELIKSQHQIRNIDVEISNANPKKSQKQSYIESNQTMDFSNSYQKSAEDSYFCISSYLKNQSASHRIECSSNDFNNIYNAKGSQQIHLDNFSEHQSTISTQSSEKECQSRDREKLLNANIQDTLPLIYPLKDLKQNEIPYKSLELPIHNLQAKIKCEVNGTNTDLQSWHLDESNRDGELNITISDFSNFCTNDIKKCIKRNSEKMKNFTHSESSKKICITSSENKYVHEESGNKSICRYDDKILDNTSLNKKSIHLEILNVKDDNDCMFNIKNDDIYSHNHNKGHQHTPRKYIHSPIKIEECHMLNQEPVIFSSNIDSSQNKRDNISKTEIQKDQIILIASDKKENELDNRENKEMINYASPCKVFSCQSSEEVKNLSQDATDRKLSKELPGNSNNKHIIKLIKYKGENGVPHYRVSKIQQSPRKIRPNSTEETSKTDDSIHDNSDIQNQVSNALKEISTNEILIKCKSSPTTNEKHISAKSKQINSEDKSNISQEEQTSTHFNSDLENTNPNMQKNEYESMSLQIENKFPKMKIKKVVMKQPTKSDEYKVAKLSTTRILRPFSNQIKIPLADESSNVTSTSTEPDNHNDHQINMKNEKSYAEEKGSSTNENNTSIDLKNPDKAKEIDNNTADRAKNKELVPPGIIIVSNNNNKADITGEVEETESEITTVFQVVKEVKPEGTFVYVCLPCELILRTNEEYDNHQVTEHSPNANQPQGGRMEIQLKKDGNDVYICKKCTTVFKTKKALSKHNRYKHNATEADKRKLSRVKNHVCGVCGRKFVFGHLLQDHINSHTGDTPYMCMVCGTRLSMRSELMCHVKLHRQS